MQDQLQLLMVLQQVDDRLRTMALAEHNLPQRLQTYEIVCTEARQRLQQHHEAIEQSERQQRVLERELASHHEALRKTQSKAHEVKTNKEYSAILLEVEAGKQRIATLEDQILVLMETTDQQREALKAQEQQVQTAEHTLTTQQQQLHQEHDALRHAMTAEQERRARTVAALDAPLYTQYQKVAAQHGGRVIAQLQAGVCTGCHLKIPPQLISEIRLQTQLYPCPHCRMILLWPTEDHRTQGIR